MDDYFNKAIETVLRHEGGYVEDHAGPTNFGITVPILRGEVWGDLDRDGDVDGNDIRLLNREQAKRVYYNQWWSRYGYGNIKYSIIATKILDLSVNMGPRQCHKLVQRACWANGKKIAIDGIIGPITMSTINTTFPIPLLTSLRSEAAGFYRLISEINPNYQKYLKGWLRRAYD